jgi:hypothetical protein
MNPVMIVFVPMMIAMSGVMCFFLLPLELWARTVVLVGDLLAAVLVGLVLLRRRGAR